jgi:hypothetical protein
MIDYKGEASFFCDKIWFATQTSLQIAFFLVAAFTTPAQIETCATPLF